MFRLLVSLLALAASFAAVGQSYRRPPQDGYWWNPAESGRGFTIETQGEIVAITHYVYDSSGRATFHQSVGLWNANAQTISTSLLSFSGGQCIGCAYVAPTNTNQGATTLNFTSQRSGEILYPNGTRVPIQRFEFGYASPQDMLLGGWNSGWYSTAGNGFANFFYISRRCTTCSNPNTMQGELKRSRTGRPVLANVTSGGVTVMLIDSAPGFFDAYYLAVESDSFFGVACTFPSSSPPPAITSCPGLVEGVRALSLEHARSLYGATKSTSALAAAPYETAQRILELRSGAKAGALPSELLEANSAQVEGAMMELYAELQK